MVSIAFEQEAFAVRQSLTVYSIDVCYIVSKKVIIPTFVLYLFYFKFRIEILTLQFMRYIYSSRCSKQCRSRSRTRRYCSASCNNSRQQRGSRWKFGRVQAGWVRYRHKHSALQWEAGTHGTSWESVCVPNITTDSSSSINSDGGNGYGSG